MILIADSGSTKTTWSLVNPFTGAADTVYTSGINPMYQDEENIFLMLEKEFTKEVEPAAIYFYGAGCINKGVNQTVSAALSRFFHCDSLTVETDLMAAARSLCLCEPGIACILGTGSNSCYYDGHEIVKNVSPLGFMLGDEGSGAVIGKKFIADLLKNQLPESVKDKFYHTYQLKPHEIIDQVYKKPFPNRFLAGFTHFIHDHPEEESLHQIVKSSFAEFFIRNIAQYREALRLPVQFTGSVAFHFEPLLREVAVALGYHTGRITASPVADLIRYHLDLQS
jgi:glucosamine kinase